MVTALNDIIDGAVTGLAWKAPARMASTANMALSGLQTVDTIVGADGDRVLVKDQTTTTENGIYLMRVGAWERAPDFDGARDVAQGTMVRVQNGTAHADTVWAVSTSAPVIGEALAWTLSLAGTVNATDKLAKLLFVTDYGVDLAGVSAAITAAIAAAPSRLVFPTNTYTMTDELGAFAGADDVIIDLNGSTLDFSGIAHGVSGNSKQLLHLTGSYSGTPVALSGNAAEGATAIACTTATFAAGDTVRIYATTQWDPNRTGARIGELAIVDTIDSASQLSLTAPLAYSYTTADSASIQKLTPIRRCQIINGTILGPRSDAVANYVEGVIITLGIDCSINGLHTFDCGLEHQRLIDCMHSKIVFGTMTRAYDDASAYGASCMDASQDCLVGWNVMRDCRHAFTTNNNLSSFGITRRILVIGNMVFNSVLNIGGSSGDALDTHAGCEEITFADNVVYGAVGIGINIEGRSATIRGNKIYGSTSHGIFFAPWCEVKAPEIVIQGNELHDIGIDDSNNARGILIQPKGGVGGGSPVFDVTKAVVIGNVVESKSEAFYAMNTNRLSLHGNSLALRISLTNVANFGVRLESCDWFSLSDNEVIANVRGISIDTCADGIVSGNVVNLAHAVTAGAYGVYSNSPRVAVNGNRIGLTGSASGTPHYGVFLDAGADYSTAQGNIIRGFATAAAQDASTGSGVANNVTAA